jgi:hypothetical protein
MSNGNSIDRQMAAVQILRLRARAQGVALGCIAAIGVFAATNWLVLKGGENVGAHLQLLSQYFVGYRVTFAGSFIGAAYGFATGFAIGYGSAAIYNTFARLRTSGSSSNA